MDSEMIIPISELTNVLSYDPETGELSWRNGRRAGFLRKDGYRYVWFKRKRWLVHRVAWALHVGAWPDRPIDHANMNRSDNRIVNLRLASVAENNRNRPKQSNNSSGYKGVTFNKAAGKYQARIMANLTMHYLGYFDDPKDAYDAYCSASKRLHGDFARQDIPEEKCL